ncbi:MAG TPA: hypothetical protein PK264_16580 [Hyphomicrobiaceae bacterium]|nr:hypothetical protein [Hyphomicrobiaceae bacterium]
MILPQKFRSYTMAILGLAGTGALAVSSPLWTGSPAIAQVTFGSLTCDYERKVRSTDSSTATTITFINKAKTYRGLNWIDFKGQQKSFGGLNPGERRTISTYRTHPWVVTTGPGDCIKIYLPTAFPATVTLR